MKFELPARFPKEAVGPTVFAGAALLCFALSIWTVDAVERFSRLAVRRALHEAGQTWAEVHADGLQIVLSGTAPTEALRFRALSVAGEAVDSTRLRDAMQVQAQEALALPEFKVEILRNDDGVSLIGLAPSAMDRAAFVADLDALAEGDLVTDMLETADYPVPETWAPTIRFAAEALKSLPRAKISVTPGQVAITAIGDSSEQKRALETKLRRDVPAGVRIALDISAPRPVITPFTLRFLIDEQGARFDACSADSERARSQILTAAIEAGLPAPGTCTIGLGVPTPDWTFATTMGIRALARLGQGSITFSDADVALIAGPGVAQADFDAVVGELESNLPEVFSLKATQTTAAEAATAAIAEFGATLSPEGRVDLTGRLRDSLTREAVESYAKSRFGSADVHAATRLDESLPDGWPKRVLVALEALAELNEGRVVVHENDLTIEGKTGTRETSGTVARILSSKLGANGKYVIRITYVAELDPTVGMPTDQECVDRANAVLTAKKIPFEPGAAVIAPEAKDTIDKLADVLKDCADYPMEVGGHTDSQGREEMNLALSEQRARAVIVALQSRRILTGNLSAKGYGETEPVMANDTEENRERNRRIEFRLLNASTPTGAAGADPDQGGTSTEAAPAIEVKTPTDDTIRPKKRPAGTGN